MKSTMIPIIQRALKEAYTQARFRYVKYKQDNDSDIMIDSAKQDVEDYEKAIKYMEGYESMMKDKEC
jgi:hypothetical protein